jgi:hypothetical protein
MAKAIVYSAIHADGTPVPDGKRIVPDHVINEFTALIRNASTPAVKDEIEQRHEVTKIEQNESLFTITVRSLQGLSENRLRELLKRWEVKHVCRRSHVTVVR